MSWHILHTRTFYKDLAKIPNQTRGQIENIAFGDEMAGVYYIAKIFIRISLKSIATSMARNSV